MKKLWFKFNSYTGNFDREFIAYMFGETPVDDDGSYSLFVREYENNSEFKSIKEHFVYSNQEVDDWFEETFYNIHSFPENKKYNCDSVFIQLDDAEIDIAQLEARAKCFVEFLKANDDYNQFQFLEFEKTTCEYVEKFEDKYDDEDDNECID